MDLSSTDLDHDELANAVRTYAASKLYDLVERMQPHIDDLVNSLPELNAHEQTAANALIRAYTTSLKDLGKLYQLDKPPILTEEMVPAASVPLMIEAAVTAEVNLAVQEALRLEREDKAQRQAVSAQEAKSRVRSVLGQVAARR